MGDDLRKLLARCDELAREHCGMPIDVERMAGNAAYRENVFHVLARSSSADLAAVLARVREQFEVRQAEGVR